MKKSISLFLFFALAQVGSALADSPALWKYSDKDTELYIFGSSHILKPGTVWLSDELQMILSDSETLYLELSAAQQRAEVMQPLVFKYGMLPADDSLKNKLPEKLYQQVAAELIEMGMPETGFSRLKPWTAATVYTVAALAKVGFDPNAGVEKTLMGLAQAKGIPVDGLETAEFQLALFDNMSDEMELDFLRQAVEDADTLEVMMDELTGYWTTGNVDALAAHFAESFAEYPGLEQSLLIDRNRDWVVKVEGIMKQPGQFMLVVGFGHLVGEDSLIELLPLDNAGLIRVQ